MFNASKRNWPPHPFHFLAETVTARLLTLFMTTVHWQADQFGRNRFLLDFALSTDLCAFERIVGAVQFKSDVSRLQPDLILLKNIFDRRSLLLILPHLLTKEVLHVQMQALTLMHSQSMVRAWHWFFYWFYIVKILFVYGSPVLFLNNLVNIVFLKLQMPFLFAKSFLSITYFCSELFPQVTKITTLLFN